MIITVDDIKRANEQSRAIAENSKKLVPPAETGPSELDRRFEAVKRTRQK